MLTEFAVFTVGFALGIYSSTIDAKNGDLLSTNQVIYNPEGPRHYTFGGLVCMYVSALAFVPTKLYHEKELKSRQSVKEM